jgi:peptidoglycan-associated lipoprotein
MSKRQISVALLSCSFVIFAAGCKKKGPLPPPPAPVVKPTPAPTVTPEPTIVSFTAEPSTIERGQSSTLRWSTQNATAARIDQGIGTVNANGTRQVFPTSTTTYTLTATGSGGTATATTTVRVTERPTEPPKPPAPPTITIGQRVANEVQDAYFDYDKSDIREDARAVLSRDADALKSILGQFSSGDITVEGHCDERGSAEYNLGLGDRRAAAAKEYLVQLGVPAGRLKTISYGKERPQCTESNEECWQKNRRAHFVSQ